MILSIHNMQPNWEFHQNRWRDKPIYLKYCQVSAEGCSGYLPWMSRERSKRIKESTTEKRPLQCVEEPPSVTSMWYAIESQMDSSCTAKLWHAFSYFHCCLASDVKLYAYISSQRSFCFFIYLLICFCISIFQDLKLLL